MCANAPLKKGLHDAVASAEGHSKGVPADRQTARRSRDAAGILAAEQC
jgi:hypothetical protein